MGRPRNDGLHELERAQTIRWFGYIKSSNPDTSIAELEDELDLTRGTFLRYARGGRALDLVELKSKILLARRKGMLSCKPRNLFSSIDKLLDDGSNKNPSQETIKEDLIKFNQELARHFKLYLSLKALELEFSESCSLLLGMANTELLTASLTDDPDCLEVSDFKPTEVHVDTPDIILHLGQAIRYPRLKRKSGAKVVQSKKGWKANEKK